MRRREKLVQKRVAERLGIPRVRVVCMLIRSQGIEVANILLLHPPGLLKPEKLRDALLYLAAGWEAVNLWEPVPGFEERDTWEAWRLSIELEGTEKLRRA